MYDLSYLDKIRLSDGAEKCKEALRDMFRRNSFTAIDLLNDRRLSFTCLYILLPIIKSLDIRLNPRNTEAVKIVDYIKNPQKSGYLSTKTDNVYSALRWILETGYEDDGLSEEFEEILEVVISILINIYNDNTILPIVSNIIFSRNKKGHCIHDLAWAYFKIKNPEALKVIAEHLKSPDNEESSLACNLLGIDENDKNYELYIKWIEDNDPFLYFTGDGFQFSSSPKVYNVDLERKYINKGTPSYDKIPLQPENDDEIKCLEVFKTLSNEDKNILSDYSYKKYSENISEWENFLHSPINKQIEEARRASNDLGSRKFV